MLPTGDDTDPPAGRLRTTDLVVGALTVLAGAFVLAALPFQVTPQPAYFGIQLSSIDPRLLPAIVGGGFVLAGIVYVLQARRSAVTVLGTSEEPTSWGRLAATAAMMWVYCIVMPEAGFVISSFALVCGMSVFYGARNIVATLVTSALVPLAVYLTFVRFLLVSLP